MLTKRQRKILDYVRDFSDRRGYAPTLSEIARHFGLSSPATVHKHLRNLEEKGALKRRWNHSRAIEVLPEPGTSRAFDLPLVGEIEGGRPVTWTAADEAVPVPAGLAGSGRSFVLRVRGAAFHGELLRDGDLVVVEESEDVPDGMTGLVLVKGTEPVIGRLEHAGDAIRLLGAAPDGAALELPRADVQVRGRVAGILRKY